MSKIMTYPGTDLSPKGFPNNCRPFLWHGGTLYKWSNAPPGIILVKGFIKTGGYDDLVTHMTVNQGIGSNWLSTTKTLSGGDGYGDFVYQIELVNDYKAVDANPAYTHMTKHRNPHAQQDEVAVYQFITPEDILGVWIPRDMLGFGPHQHQLVNTVGYSFADRYDFFTREQFLRDLPKLT